MKANYREIRKMLGYDLRALCIRNWWYTRGNNDEYASLLNKVDNTENLTTGDIVEIAMDIINHSDNINIDDEEDFENVCYELLEICHTFIEKV